MGTLAKVLIVGLGGGIGANLRYWLGLWIGHVLGTSTQRPTPFPWATFAINVSGSFLMGIFLGLVLTNDWKDSWRLFVAIGILGGYTTFSSFAYEAVRLLSEREYGIAFLYVEGSAVLTVLAAWVGVALGSKL